MSSSDLQHKAPSAHSDHTSTTPNPHFSIHDILATHQLNSLQEVKSQYSSVPSSSHFAPLRRILSIPVSIPKTKLLNLLHGIYPLTFPNFLRLHPLSSQLQLQNELASIPPHLSDLTLFSTNFEQLPGLSLIYRQYLTYRQNFTTLHKPIYFSSSAAHPTFTQFYNRPDAQLSIFRNQNEAFFHLFRTKTIPASIASSVSTISFAKPCWLVMAYIPQEKTNKDIMSIASKVTGFSTAIVLPIEPLTQTKIAFLSYKNATNRDNALDKLNGQMSDKILQGKTTANTKDTAKPGEKKDSTPSSTAFKIQLFPWVSSSQFELDLASEQHQIKSKQSSSLLPTHNIIAPTPQNSLITPSRQPIIPIGLKQWTVGPISRSKIINRIDTLLSQALLTAQFFDYIRLTPQASDITAIVGHFDQIIPKNSTATSSTTTSNNTNDPSTDESTEYKLLKLQLYLKYLHQVHLYDFFTSTLYPTKDTLISDVGEEWYILDLPEFSQLQSQSSSQPQSSSNHSNQSSSSFTQSNSSSQPAEMIEKGFLTTTIDSIHTSTTQNQFSTNSSSHNPVFSKWKLQAELISSQTTPYTSSLKHIPIDPSFSPQNRALTCLYNAILACSPPQKVSQSGSNQNNDNNHSSSFTPIVQYNFWYLQQFYQQLFYQPSSSSSSSTTDNNNNYNQMNNGDDDSTSTQSPISSLSVPLITSTSTEFPPIQSTPASSSSSSTTQPSSSSPPQHQLTLSPTPFLSTTTPFWDSIDSTIDTISQLFDPSSMKITPETNLDSIDPDLLYFASTLSIDSPNYAYPTTYPLISSSIPSNKTHLPKVFNELLKNVLFSQHFTQPAPSRYQCKHCQKLMISLPTIVKHISTQHSTALDSVLIELMQNELYFRYSNDRNSLSFTPPSLSTTQSIYVKRNFVFNHTNNNNNKNNNSSKSKPTTELFQVNFPHYELRTYKRNLLVKDKIDACWDEMLTMYKLLLTEIHRQCVIRENRSKKIEALQQAKLSSEIQQQMAASSSSNNLDDIDDGSNMVIWGAKRVPGQYGMADAGSNNTGRDLALEKQAEKFKQARQYEKLFKGIDGDGIGFGKTAKLQWTTLGDSGTVIGLDDEHTEVDSKQQLQQLKKLTKFQESLQHFLILDSAQPQQPIDYTVIDDFSKLFETSERSGLDPFVGQ